VRALRELKVLQNWKAWDVMVFLASGRGDEFYDYEYFRGSVLWPYV
jgi:hypothetical protein